jgi:hypothetical protein
MATDLNCLSKGVITGVMGGLGNQLFTYAAGYVVAKTHNVPLFKFKDDPESNKHNKKKVNYNESILKYIGVELPYSNNDYRILHALQHFGYKEYNYTVYHSFEVYIPEQLMPNIRLSGYFQYYPPLEPYEHELRNLILKGLDDHIQTIKPLYNYDTCAFLHIRRGDYLEYADIHFNQPLSYYESAVIQLLTKNPLVSKILLVSDDMEWVKQQDYFKQPLFEYTNFKDELETIAAMSQCAAGAICANSTFSWWGAFLGAHGKRSPVFVPSNWIKQKLVALFPDEWHVI